MQIFIWIFKLHVPHLKSIYHNIMREMFYGCFISVVLQCPLKYEIAGEGLSTSLFRIDEKTGLITLKQSFTTDVGTFYTVSKTYSIV